MGEIKSQKDRLSLEMTGEFRRDEKKMVGKQHFRQRKVHTGR